MEIHSKKISERILKEIRKNSEKDEAICGFLIDMLFEEAENPDIWRWKEIYNKGMEKYMKKEETDENR